MLEILRKLYSKYFEHFDDESNCKYDSDDEENASFNIDVFEEAPGGVPRSLHWCALLVWNIFCVELLLSRADLRHLVCNFTRSWLAIAALAFQTKSDGWIY